MILFSVVILGSVQLSSSFHPRKGAHLLARPNPPTLGGLKGFTIRATVIDFLFSLSNVDFPSVTGMGRRYQCKAFSGHPLLPPYSRSSWVWVP